jgi:hypothetical protein
LREHGRKTVMAAKDSHPTHGFEPGGIGSPAAERKVLDHLFSVTYEELRRLASSVRRGDPSATLSPTALVNEAWIKLAKSPDIAATSFGGGGAAAEFGEARRRSGNYRGVR